jgi:hypothetical protein
MKLESFLRSETRKMIIHKVHKNGIAAYACVVAGLLMTCLTTAALPQASANTPAPAPVAAPTPAAALNDDGGTAGGFCDDGIFCTIDSGDFFFGCTHTPDNSRCDDFAFCTTDICDSNLGCQYFPNNGLCFDNNPCTVDICQPFSGCFFPPNNGAPCGDQNNCTVNDICLNGGCSGTQLDCDDQIPCTQDFCIPGIGCVNQPIDVLLNRHQTLAGHGPALLRPRCLVL